MSHDTDSNGNDSAHEPTVGKVVDAANQLISPQGERQSPTVVANIAETTKSIGHAALSTLATVADIPLGALSLAVSTPNNLVGLVHKGVNAGVARPIDWTRGKVRKLITHPVATMTGTQVTETRYETSA